MAANTGERTLISAIIPPGATHVDAVFSAGLRTFNAERLLLMAGYLASLLSDFSVRTSPKSNIRFSTAARTPLAMSFPLNRLIAARAALLNCITEAWAPLWEEAYSPEWSAARPSCKATHEDPGVLVGGRPSENRTRAPTSSGGDRCARCVVASRFGDELCTVYRTQFAVLYGYDRNVYFYDANGRLVPNEVLKVWRQKQDAISEEERTATNPRATPTRTSCRSGRSTARLTCARRTHTSSIS